jgi:hypothetical protein
MTVVREELLLGIFLIVPLACEEYRQRMKAKARPKGTDDPVLHESGEEMNFVFCRMNTGVRGTGIKLQAAYDQGLLSRFLIGRKDERTDVSP